MFSKVLNSSKDALVIIRLSYFSSGLEDTKSTDEMN